MIIHKIVTNNKKDNIIYKKVGGNVTYVGSIKKDSRSMFDRPRIRNIACAITSYIWLVIRNRCSNCSCRVNVVILLEKECGYLMTIVVKKVPKFLRGFVKFIFGIKD